MMASLEYLNLDSCRIQEIHPGTFTNLPNLRTLSLKGNLLFTVPEAVVLPSLHELYFQGMPEMFMGGGRFTIPEGIFEIEVKMELKVLSLSACHLGELRSSMLSGLDGLERLILDQSDISEVTDGAFSYLGNLKNLSLVDATGVEYMRVSLLDGLTGLIALDMSNINAFPDDIEPKSKTNTITSDHCKSDSNPLATVKILKLSGSLANIEKPLEYLNLESLPDLEELNLSRNKIVSWNSLKFETNKNLSAVIMSDNVDYVNITMHMIRDFQVKF